jgi:hypothetical protein
VTAAEGEGSASLAVVVELTPTNVVVVGVEAMAITAERRRDFNNFAGQLRFEPGVGTNLVTVGLADDFIAEKRRASRCASAR